MKQQKEPKKSGKTDAMRAEREAAAEERETFAKAAERAIREQKAAEANRVRIEKKAPPGKPKRK